MTSVMRTSKTQAFQLDVNEPEVGERLRLIALGRTTVVIRTADGTEAPAPEVVGRVVRMVAAGLAEGHAIVVAESDATVSPAEAAQMLAVSRPMVTRWITEGLLADAPVGTHHRIPVESVLALGAARSRAGQQAMRLLEAAEKQPEVATRVEAAQQRARNRVAARPES